MRNDGTRFAIRSLDRTAKITTEAGSLSISVAAYGQNVATRQRKISVCFQRLSTARQVRHESDDPSNASSCAEIQLGHSSVGIAPFCGLCSSFCRPSVNTSAWIRYNRCFRSWFAEKETMAGVTRAGNRLSEIFYKDLWTWPCWA